MGSTCAPTTWNEVGHSKSYTATLEDVGYCLKFEVVPVDVGTHAEAAAVTVVTTGRVIPAPTPPRQGGPHTTDARLTVLHLAKPLTRIDGTPFVPEPTKGVPLKMSRCTPQGCSSEAEVQV